MIYIEYHRLQQVLQRESMQDNARLSVQDRQDIRNYRLKRLQHYAPAIEIEVTTHGKPIAKLPNTLAFNHSHSQAHYALAYSDTVADLGIDIEDMSRNVRMMHALAKKSFHPDEYRMWQSLDYCREFWFKVWTIKEAVLKAHGLGIRLDLHSLNTHAHPTWDFGRVEHLQLGVFMYQHICLAKSMLTVAYRYNTQNLSPIKLDLHA